jgi:hypothetical protein
MGTFQGLAILPAFILATKLLPEPAVNFTPKWGD